MQYQKPVITQTQKLKMNPQLYQAIRIMALPLQELKFRIQEEVEKNPALEVLNSADDVSLEDLEKRATEVLDRFENSSDPGYTGNISGSSEDSKQKFIEGALSRPESLHEHLLWQLRLQPISLKWFKIGELLIQNLDDNGFHIEPPQKLIPKAYAEILPKVMELIQNLEPLGVCTKDSWESLQVQATRAADAPKGTLQLLTKHADLLEKGKIVEIAKKMKRNNEEVQGIIQYIKTLNPYPGAQYSDEKLTYVVPDLSIIIKDHEFFIILNEEEIPVLGINPFFQSMLEGKAKKDKTLRKFVNHNLKNAEWFIRTIRQRNETLLKTAKAIIEFQRNFFLKGPKYLVPLTLKDVANEVNVHETTISRIANAKYVQTEWGIFPVKYFFTNSISGSGSGGSRFSKEGVKEIIKEIIDQEGRGLSDQKITDLLQKRGIKLARRTVAKYRKELNIMSSYSR